MSLQGNSKVHCADPCDPEIAFLGSLTLAELCWIQELGKEQAGWGAPRPRVRSSKSPQTPLTLHSSASSGVLQALAGPHEGTRDVAPTFTA